LELFELGWRDSYRPFERVATEYQEVHHGTPVESGRLIRVREAVFVLKARLISVHDGRVLMSLDISQGTSRVIEPAKDLEIGSTTRGEAKTITTDTPARRIAIMDQVVRTLLAKLVQAPAAAAPPAAVAPPVPAPPAAQPTLPSQPTEAVEPTAPAPPAASTQPATPTQNPPTNVGH
jgi:hypothetical protein